MEINSFIENFSKQFDETNKEEFFPKKKFREIEEWSSMQALMIIAMADETYHVKLSGDEIRKSETIEDLFLIIKAKM